MALFGREKIPAPISISNLEQHRPFQIEMAFHARGLGYEPMLENGMSIFIYNVGSHLDHDGMHYGLRNAHRGDYHCMMGDTLDVNRLPEIGHSFIADNYPGITIGFMVLNPSGKMCVELSDETVLMLALTAICSQSGAVFK